MRLASALSLLALISTVQAAESLPYRYWPRFPRPHVVLRVPFVGDHEEGMTFETAAGLAARACLHGSSDVMVLEDVTSTSYLRWTSAMLALVKPRTTGPMDTWALVADLKQRGIVRGYLLFRYDTNNRPWHGDGPIDESANVATSLAPVFSAVAVSEKFAPRAEALGLPMLFDARDRTEQWCLDRYAVMFSRRVLMTADPKSRVARSMGVALDAFVVSHPGPTYEAALARCEPDSPVLGWGCGGEDTQTMASTRWGLFQTATNWSHNLTVYSTEQVGDTIPRAKVTSPRAGLSFADLRWESGVHYATFIMSDGDNVQWLMGNFTGGSEGSSFYDSTARGRFPFGWTINYPNLAQLCPYVLEDLFAHATPRDDFVCYGNGYMYPDLFGEKRPGANSLALHARRLGEYLRFSGIHSLAFNLQDWDGPAAIAAYSTLARNIPTLDGIFTVQYYPYSGGEGRILWTSRGSGPAGPPGDVDVPIVSCAACIWANTGRPRDATPAATAARLNSSPTGGATWSDANFTFVMSHCWSRFRDTHGDPSLTAEDGADQDHDAPDTARGLLPTQWTVDRLGPKVRVVTPGEVLLLVRLHLRTRQTLTAFARQVRASFGGHPPAAAARFLTRAEALLPSVRDGDDSGRECFTLLRTAARVHH